MRNIDTNPRVVDASGEPQRPFRIDTDMEFVELEDYVDPLSIDAELARGSTQTPLEEHQQEEDKETDEEDEEFPIPP